MKLAEKAAQERRQEVRYSLFGELPVRLFHEATGAELPFTPVDISRQGLGLLLTPSPAQGEVLRLEFIAGQRPPLRLICRHVYLVTEKPVSGFESMRRCGFELLREREDECDLVALFASFDSVIIGD